MKRHQSLLVAIIGYTILIGLVFGASLFPQKGQMLFGDDIHRQYYFYREFFNYWVSHGVFPWWNPYLFGGEPFIANPVVNIWYPPNWLFFFLPLNIAYSWHIALHIFWACLGMFVLLIGPIGLIRPIRPISAFVGGILFGLSGFFMSRTFAGHVDVIAAASFMPWVVRAFAQVIRLELRVHSKREQRKVIEIAAITFALQLLAGYQTMAFFTVIAVGIVTFFESVKQKSVRPLILVFIALFIGVCLSAIQILPASEFFVRSIRTFQFPYSWHSYGSLEFKSLLQFINPFYFGNQYTYTGPAPNFIEHSAFVGVGGLILALIGFVNVIVGTLVASTIFRVLRSFASAQAPSAQGSKLSKLPVPSLGFVLITITFFGLWVSLGPNAPFDLQKFLWQMVPMYHYLRIPPRHLILVVFGLAGLSGIGMEFGFRRLPRLLKVLRLPIMGIVIIEMVLFARSFIELKPIPETRHDKELISVLKKDTKPYRLLQNFGVWVAPRDALDFDSVMAYGIFSATGYDPSILRSYYEYIARASGTTGQEAVLSQDVQVPYLTQSSGLALDQLNIKYIMVPLQYDSFTNNVRYHLLRDVKDKDYRIYENTTVFERFYLGNSKCGDVTVTSYTPNRVNLTTNTTCDTELLSSEVNYPGWHVTIDGKETHIYESNIPFRTLFVPKGTHTIVYEYQPTIFVVGGVISFITMLSLILFCL